MLTYVGMRVEMREAALSKARGVGVVTNVSRKGTHTSAYVYVSIRILSKARGVGVVTNVSRKGTQFTCVTSTNVLLVQM
jgi:hypothetical protein